MVDKSKIVNVSDINRKRSSLKNPMHSEEMRKMFESKKSGHLHFVDLESIEEKKEEEVSILLFLSKSLKKRLRQKLMNLLKKEDNLF